MLGILANESRLRRKAWILQGCEYTPRQGIARLHPLAFWTDKNIWEYIRRNNLKYPGMYDKGYVRSMIRDM